MAKYEVDDLLRTIDTAHKRLDKVEALFQECLKHLEVALDVCPVGLECPKCCVTDMYTDHEPSCPIVAAERFLEKHRQTHNASGSSDAVEKEVAVPAGKGKGSCGGTPKNDGSGKGKGNKGKKK